MLVAHDVTWFSHIDELAVGSSLSVVTPCRTFLYAVRAHSVITAGSPIYQTVAPRLVLVTCYPLNALFLTSQRYEVDATLSRIVYAGSAASGPVSVAPRSFRRPSRSSPRAWISPTTPPHSAR